MKTYYSYDTNDNKWMIKVQTVLIVCGSIGGIAGIIGLFFPGQRMLSIALLAACVLIVLGAIPARKKYEHRVKQETIISHDWGIEHQDGEDSREAKWDQIIKIETNDKSFLMWKMKEYVVVIASEYPIKFYSCLENCDFLVNYIKKNLKKQAENPELKWKK
jgi:hypothetical protein